MTEDDDVNDCHPLDDSDPDQCYKVMMAERTVLITARREAEDNLIKTIIQLSVALIVLMAGFITQADVSISEHTRILFGATIILFGLAIIMGLSEQWLSSKAYEQQQQLVEDFYNRKIAEFSPIRISNYVRATQTFALALFVIALAILSIFAFMQAGAKTDDKQRDPTATASSSSSSSSSSSAAAASAASSAAAAAAAEN